MSLIKRHLLKIIFLILVITAITSIINYYNNRIANITKSKKILQKKYEGEYNDLQKLTDKIILDRENKLLEKNQEINSLNNNLIKLKSYLQIKDNNIQSLIENSPLFKVTAYDLSEQSCNKSRTNRAFGITASGYKLTGLDLRSASTIATDPNVIPLGTPVYLYFNIDSIFNGIYISSDKGSAIKGNRIDLFVGDNPSTGEALNFGIKYAKVIKLDNI